MHSTPLLGIFGPWEVLIEYVNLRSYTTVFQFAAPVSGYVAVRCLIPPPAKAATE